MNARENLISLVRRQGYERMPVDFSMTPGINNKFKDYIRETGYTYPSSPFFSLPWPLEKKPKADEFWKAFYGHDFKEGTSFSSWGVANEPGSEACLHMTKMYHPLENMTTLEELMGYPYPELKKGNAGLQKAMAFSGHAQGMFVIGGMQCTIWETAWYMRGMETLMMDMMVQPELANFVLDRVTENAVATAVSFARAGADGIYLGDDIGMQSTIMMSLDLYREYLKPRLKKVIDAARAVKKDIIVFYHSCGYVTPFIEDLIEAGVDVLNPVQPESMNFEAVFKEYGDRLSFCGTLGTQTTMPFGKPDAIRKEIVDRLDFVGPKGGLLLCPTHILEPEVPVENLVAYIEACREYNPVKDVNA